MTLQRQDQLCDRLSSRPVPAVPFVDLVAERQASRIISLPIHQELTEQQVQRVCDVVEDFFR